MEKGQGKWKFNASPRVRERKCHSYPRCSEYLNTLLDRSIEKRYYNEKTRKESLAILFPPSSRRRPFLDDNLASLP